MKRIETLSAVDRSSIVRTLNDASLNGKAPYSCLMNDCACKGCPVSNACSGFSVGDRPVKTFIGWLTWLVDEVEKPEISSGLNAFCTSLPNHYCIEREDDLNFNKIYAQVRPLTALFFDKNYLKFIDVFVSRNGVACILAKDNRSGENVIYIDKDI